MNNPANGPAASGGDPATPLAIETPASARWHVAYCLVVTLAVVALKLWIALDIQASAMVSDDYEYLNKSPYYLHGDLIMESYLFINEPTRILYPLVLSPWLLADDPNRRLYVVH